MRLEDLSILSIQQLANIRNKNLIFFSLILLIDLVVFYSSLYNNQWLTLFFSFGVFIASLSLYDNYRIASNMILARENAV